MNLINELPSFYYNTTANFIQDGLSSEAELVNTIVSNTLDQMFVEKATHGLDRWEKMLGIPKNNFNLQTRRENIKAKMRSRGTSSIEVIKNICEAYSNGIVEINVDYSNYSFEISFISTIGVPLSFEELDRVINEIKPCHLAHSYKFNYNTHSDISNYTHEQLANYTHEEIRNSSELRGGK